MGRALDQFFSDAQHDGKTRPTQEAFLSLMAKFSPDFITEVLGEIQHDQGTLKQVAANSYQHPAGTSVTGFSILRLYRHPIFNDAQVRLHIWNEGKDAADQNVHMHRWDMVSQMLLGEFLNVSYDANLRPDAAALNVIEKVNKAFAAMNGDQQQQCAAIIHELEILKCATSLERDMIFGGTRSDLDANALHFELMQRLHLSTEEMRTALSAGVLYRQPARDSDQHQPYVDGHALLKRSNLQHIVAGDTYYHPIGTPHRVVANAAATTPTVTLLITTPKLVEDHEIFFVQGLGSRLETFHPLVSMPVEAAAGHISYITKALSATKSGKAYNKIPQTGLRA
jgi:hypothetical protein